VRKIFAKETFPRTHNGARFTELTMQVQVDPVIPFISMPPITLDETRKVYLPD
jgi:hypothetical protein